MSIQVNSDVNIEQVVESIRQLGQKYAAYQTIIDPQQQSELCHLAQTFQQDADNAKNENRVLRIGIVGQVKRGKSSFLNSLLFGGESILPKAATPMTAALTKLSYGEQPEATVEFYSKNEWDRVVDSAKRCEGAQRDYERALAEFKQAPQERGFGRARPPRPPQFSEEAEACYELYQMVQRSGLNVHAYLDTTERISESPSNQELMTRLNDYVGANGTFTPIVKSTALKLNIEGLKDLEVVDTPGMNDPIVSRGQRTREYLGQCDVVFLLSYCGQFLDMHDMSLLAQNIPNKGIEEIVLIGSIFDSVLLDDYHNYPSIVEALQGVTYKLNQQAQLNVESVCRQETEQQSGQNHLMQALQNALPPIFISSRCFDLAHKQGELNEEEAHTLKRLNGMYPGFTFSPENLAHIANFNTVSQKLAKVRASKASILAQRFSLLHQGTQRQITTLLCQMQENAQLHKRQLEQGDLAELEHKQTQLIQRVESGSAQLGSVFHATRSNVERIMSVTMRNLENDARAVKRVRSQSGTREEAYTTYYTVSTSKWYNPFSWGSTRTVECTNYRTVGYTYANVQDAVSQLEDFITSVYDNLHKASVHAVDMNNFRTELKQAVRSLFDFTDPDFDPQALLLPLNSVVDRIQIPMVDLDLESYIHKIRDQFTSTEVEGDQIDALRSEQARIVELLMNEVSREVDRCVSEIVQQLTREEGLFVGDLTTDIQQRLQQLKRDLEDRERALEEYTGLIETLEQDIRQQQQC